MSYDIPQAIKTDMMMTFLALNPDMMGNEDREAVEKAYSEHVDYVMRLGIEELQSRILFMKEHAKEEEE